MSMFYLLIYICILVNKRKAQKENQLNIYIGSFVDMKSKQNQALKQDVFYEGKLLNLYYLKDNGQEFTSKGHENYTVINKVMQDAQRRKLFMSYDSNENRMKWRKKKLFNLKIKSKKENNNEHSQNLNSSIVNSTNIENKNANTEKENKKIKNIDIISINNTFQSNTKRKNTDYSNKHSNVLVSNSVKQTKSKVILLNKNMNSIKNSFINNRNTNSSTKDCDLTELPSFKINSSINNANNSNVKSTLKTKSVFNNFLTNNKKDYQNKLNENKLNTLNLLNSTHNSTNRSYTKLQKLGYINLSPKNICDFSTSQIRFFNINRENEKNENIMLNNTNYNQNNSNRSFCKKEINKSKNISKHELNKSARPVSKTNTKIDFKLRKT